MIWYPITAFMCGLVAGKMLDTFWGISHRYVLQGISRPSDLGGHQTRPMSEAIGSMTHIYPARKTVRPINEITECYIKASYYDDDLWRVPERRR